jgi:hypothetical protein
MDRRNFVQFLGGTAALSPLAAASPQAQGEQGRKTTIYRLEYMYLRQGDQGNRINQFLASQMPLIQKHVRTFGVFTATVGPYTPATLVLAGFSGLEEMEAAAGAIVKDSGYRAAYEEMEKGSEPPYDYADQVLLRATDFSPEIVPLKEKPKTPRYFELRVYHSPTQRQLRQLHERFGGSETGIFHRVGVHPILYADTMIGPNMPNLTYLTPFDSLAAREKAWDAFTADPEWVKVRAESVARGGQIVSYNSITLWRPAPFSPIQ